MTWSFIPDYVFLKVTMKLGVGVRCALLLFPRQGVSAADQDSVRDASSGSSRQGLCCVSLGSSHINVSVGGFGDSVSE